MKKSILLFALFCGAVFAGQSQEFKPFRVDGGVGYGIPFEKSMNGGLLFYAEPKYEITQQLGLGLRWEGSLFAGSTEGASISLGTAYLATGDYYFGNKTFRPFVGLGVGMYNSGSMSVNIEDPAVSQEIDIEAKTNFGGFLRAGFDVSHFRLALSYNYAGKVYGETHHYLGLTVGFYIGGGKNK